MNLYFSTEEINLLCIYDAGDRRKTIRSLRNMKRYLMYDEDELRSLTEGAISKLKNMTDPRKHIGFFRLGLTEHD